MKTAIIDGRGTKFAYLDSGAVLGDTYTTLVIVHGHTYHAQTFKKLFPIAARYNIRVVAINRRDYVGSTPFTPKELATLNSQDADAHKTFLTNRGLEIARFMTWFVRKHCIPMASEDGTSGGLALLGWSSGTLTTMAFLRHLESYPSDVIEALEPYFRTQILYEPAFSALGYPLPEGYYHPFLDPTIHEKARGVAFGTWISSYYTHPSLSSRSLSGLSLRIPTHPCRSPTNETFHPDEFLSLIDPIAARRSENQWITNMNTELMHDQMKGGMFDAERGGKWLPRTKVTVMVCRQSVYTIIWGMWKLEEEMATMSEEQRNARILEIKFLDRGNHFLHYDDPELFMRTCAEAIARPSPQ